MEQDVRDERVAERAPEAVGRPGKAGTPDEARANIERARGRISETLDEIEGRIEAKKQALKERVDLLRPVRRRVRSSPLPMVGAALAAGLVLGVLVGRGDDEEEEAREPLGDEERSELRRLRAERSQEDGGERSTMRKLRRLAFQQLGGALSGAVAAAINERVRGSNGRAPERSRKGMRFVDEAITVGGD